MKSMYVYFENTSFAIESQQGGFTSTNILKIPSFLEFVEKKLQDENLLRAWDDRSQRISNCTVNYKCFFNMKLEESVINIFTV